MHAGSFSMYLPLSMFASTSPPGDMIVNHNLHVLLSFNLCACRVVTGLGPAWNVANKQSG